MKRKYFHLSFGWLGRDYVTYLGEFESKEEAKEIFMRTITHSELILTAEEVIQKGYMLPISKGGKER